MLRVFVYYNLHKKCWSIKALEGHKKGLVIAHVDKLQLKNVTFKVSEAGRQRVLTQKRKNVHAGVVGTLVKWDYFMKPNAEVVYNPYLFENFRYKPTGIQANRADNVIMDGKRVYTAKINCY